MELPTMYVQQHMAHGMAFHGGLGQHSCSTTSSVAIEPSSTQNKFASIRVLHQFGTVRQSEPERSVNQTVAEVVHNTVMGFYSTLHLVIKQHD